MFWKSYVFNRWNAKRNGRRDAKFNFPSAQEPTAGYLGELERVAEKHQLDEADGYTRRDRKLDKRIQRGIEQETREGKRLIEVEAICKERGLKPVFPLWMHFLFLLFLVIGEFALNEVAFRDFEDRPVQTVLMTMLVGTFVVVMAHFVGRTLKKPLQSKTERVLIAFAVALAIGASWAVAAARVNFIATKHAPSLVSAVRSVSFVSPKVPAPMPDEARGAKLLMFVVFQLAAFLAGTLTAYASADPLEEQRRKQGRARNRREHAVTDERNWWERKREKAQRWASIAKQIEAAYWGENIKFRSDGAKQGDVTHIDPKMPEGLSEFKAYEPTSTKPEPYVTDSSNGQVKREDAPEAESIRTGREVKK